MNHIEAEKAADYLLNELLSFAEKPTDAKEKVAEWFEKNCKLDEIKKLNEYDFNKYTCGILGDKCSGCSLFCEHREENENSVVS